MDQLKLEDWISEGFGGIVWSSGVDIQLL